MHVDLKVWLDHFEYHATHRCVLPEGRPDGLTGYESRLIADSIATFQLGEQSEGRSLLRAAEDYEREHEAAPLARIVSLMRSLGFGGLQVGDDLLEGTCAGSRELRAGDAGPTAASRPAKTPTVPARHEAD